MNGPSPARAPVGTLERRLRALHAGLRAALRALRDTPPTKR